MVLVDRTTSADSYLHYQYFNIFCYINLLIKKAFIVYYSGKDQTGIRYEQNNTKKTENENYIQLQYDFPRNAA